MTDRIQELVEKAKRSLKAAKRLSKSGDYDFAVSRAYYAMFYVAQAALLTKGLEYSKHTGVVSGFGEHFVKTGIFSRDMGKKLTSAFEARMIGDYDLPMPSKKEAERMLKDAEAFVSTLSKYLKPWFGR